MNEKASRYGSDVARFQRRFAAVPKVVVGRRIAEVKVDRLAGSSGTPDGFNDALRQIQALTVSTRASKDE